MVECLVADCTAKRQKKRLIEGLYYYCNFRSASMRSGIGG